MKHYPTRDNDKEEYALSIKIEPAVGNLFYQKGQKFHKLANPQHIMSISVEGGLALLGLALYV